jgi:hypothetical protein
MLSNILAEENTHILIFQEYTVLLSVLQRSIKFAKYLAIDIVELYVILQES